MKLEQYQRVKFLTHIRPLFVKDECEVCGEINDLELHHEEQFVVLLKNTLDELNLEYLEDTSMYTKEQLNIITDLMLGKQVRTEYATLCKKCHVDIHNVKGKEKLFFKVKKIADINRLEEEFISKYQGVKIFKNNKDELENIFRNCGYKEKTFGIKRINEFLINCNIPFKITSKREMVNGDRNTFWQLVKKE